MLWNRHLDNLLRMGKNFDWKQKGKKLKREKFLSCISPCRVRRLCAANNELWIRVLLQIFTFNNQTFSSMTLSRSCTGGWSCVLHGGSVSVSSLSIDNDYAMRCNLKKFSYWNSCLGSNKQNSKSKIQILNYSMYFISKACRICTIKLNMPGFQKEETCPVNPSFSNKIQIYDKSHSNLFQQRLNNQNYYKYEIMVVYSIQLTFLVNITNNIHWNLNKGIKRAYFWWIRFVWFAIKIEQTQVLTTVLECIAKVRVWI